MAAVIGFIGAGNMGSAVVKGLSGAADVRLVGFDPDRKRLDALHEECGLVPVETAGEVVRESDYVMLCVKPQLAKAVLCGIASELTPGKCLASIAAGVTLKRLAEYSGGACPVVRIMPNTPALVGAGVFAVCLDDERLTDAQKAFVPDMFSGVGQVHVLEEKYFDAFTAVAGCGPAYVMYFMEALVEAGVYLGLSRPQTTDIVTALFEGSVKLAEQSDLHMSELREMVTSPAGSTIRGTAHLDRMAVRSAVIDAVAAACARNKELGE